MSKSTGKSDSSAQTAATPENIFKYCDQLAALGITPSRDLDFLEKTFLTTDVWEALRVYQTVPKGNASLDVTFRLKETSWEWRTEPVDTVFGSSRRSSTVVKTSSKYQLLLPARIDGDVLEVARAIYIRQPASEKPQ